jgi:hypothetical protein
VVAGVTYWIVFKPVYDSLCSEASSGTPITHVWDFGGDGWDGKSTKFNWMAKFYKEVEFDWNFRLDPYAAEIHFNIDPSGMWMYGYFAEETPWNPILGKVAGGHLIFGVDVWPDQDPDFVETLFFVVKISTMAGQFIRTTDGLTWDGPWPPFTLVPITSESGGGPSITEASVAPEVSPEAWYTFQMNPYADIVHLNTNPGTIWLNGYDSIYDPDAPILGAMAGGKFFYMIDFIGQIWELAFYDNTVSTMDGYYIYTKDGTNYRGPDYVWYTPVTSTPNEDAQPYAEGE